MLHTRHTSRTDVELTLPEAREDKAGCRPARRPYRWAFPEMTRPQTGTRGLSIALRTLHLASFGILLGGHAFAIESNQLLPALYLTIASGAGLIALEVYIIGLYWLFLGKGVMVFLKLAMILAVPLSRCRPRRVDRKNPTTLRHGCCADRVPNEGRSDIGGGG